MNKSLRILITLSLALIFFGTQRASAESCAFCRQEVIEGQSVFKGEYFQVLIDYQPRVKGHLLIVPTRHVVKAHELSKEEWEELSLLIPKAVKVFAQFLHTDQYIILEKNGPRAFQHVPHVHFHLFPITSQKGWREIFDIVPRQLSREELEEEIALFRFYFSERSS